MKKFLEEFKAFAQKGNMMDMYIDVIIRGAFSSLEAPKAPTQEELLTEILAVLKEQQAANGK